MDQIDPRQRCRRRPRQQLGGVAGKQPDVANAAGLDLRQDLGHAVDVGLAADEAGLGMSLGLRDQMLAAAEPDLELDLVDRRFEQLAKPGRWRGREIERQLRQQIRDQLGLMRPQLVALAAPEERAVTRVTRRPGSRPMHRADRQGSSVVTHWQARRHGVTKYRGVAAADVIDDGGTTGPPITQRT